MNKLTSLINVYPYLLMEDNITDEVFSKYKRWIYETEYKNMSFNSGQVQYRIEADSMEEIFIIAMGLTESCIKWKFHDIMKKNSVYIQSNNVYRNKIWSDEIETGAYMKCYSLEVNLPLKYNNYINFLECIIGLCSRNDFSIQILRDFPNIYMTGRDRYIKGTYIKTY